ncbi:dimethylaniline monooxygenase [N-oxide-forming] 2-like [Gastrophryne carolinensis]
MVKSVAVIGAGASGLSAVKVCLEEGLEPTCFERSDDVGGLWRFTDEVEDGRASIYKSLVSNISKEIMCFSDFPMPADFPNFLPNHKYFEYLKLYADNFHLLKCIQFKTVVCCVEKHADFPLTGQWIVTTERGGEVKTATFDAVLVCSGQYASSNMPTDMFPGINTFKGKVLHSKEYKRPLGYEGKRVLVVGMGNSGVDISTELCTRTSQVYLTTRNGVWVIPRLGKDGYPFDVCLLRRFKNMVENMLPAAVSRMMLRNYLRKRFNHELYNIQPEGIMWKEPLANEELPSRILCGSIIIKPGVTRFTETAAHFSDGSVVDNLDVVIFSTGHTFKLPFLEESDLKKDARKGYLYKKMIPLGIEKPTIAFISFIQPVGSLTVTAELQSRWATRLFKGLHKLPNATGIKEEMLKDEKRRIQWFGTSENNCIRTNYITYLDDIASDIGVKPKILKLFLTDPALALRVVFGPCNSYHFRLNGPGKWAGARDAILTQWDRIEKPLRTRVPKKESKSAFTSFMFLFIFFTILIAAVLLNP